MSYIYHIADFKKWYSKNCSNNRENQLVVKFENHFIITLLGVIYEDFSNDFINLYEFCICS
jgi:hypothetical protein